MHCTLLYYGFSTKAAQKCGVVIFSALESFLPDGMHFDFVILCPLSAVINAETVKRISTSQQ